MTAAETPVGHKDLPRPPPQHFVHHMPFGATVLPGDGGVRFRLWAPADRRIALRWISAGRDERFDAPLELDGWREVVVKEAAVGDGYQWIVASGDGENGDGDGEVAVPDPASRSNPDGVHAPSRVVDPCDFAWDPIDVPWSGRPWNEAVIYELHVGAFTPEGTFAAAQDKLAGLAEIGITAIELMPLASFPGRFGWGYDGVLPFAPHAAYGTPDELKHFIRAAHRLGLMVLLDVVYNHFGPDGNYLPLYAPQFFTERHHTAWGAAINFDGERGSTVRDFFIHNTLYWLHEYRFDGLRFDAVHAILDDSEPDILQEIADRAHGLGSGGVGVGVDVGVGGEGRYIHLILENENNDVERLTGALPDADPMCFEAQWADDFHHVLHTMLTGETSGYYKPYAADPLGGLARALTEGFVLEAGPNHDDKGKRIRRPAETTAPLSALVNFVENHDQVGNRAFGERLSQLADEAPMRLAVALNLLGPSVPMLFMGEENGASTPFLYFADWTGDLRQAVTEGRRKEFAHFPEFSDESRQHEIPDPCDAATFQLSKLDWASFQDEPNQRWRAVYAELLALRRIELWPDLERLEEGAHESVVLGERALTVRWSFAPTASEPGKRLEVTVNLSDQPLSIDATNATVAAEGRVIHTVGDVGDQQFGPWSGRWRWIESPVADATIATAAAAPGFALEAEDELPDALEGDTAAT